MDIQANQIRKNQPNINNFDNHMKQFLIKKVCVYIYIHTHVYVCTDVYICMNVCVCMYVYIYTHTHTV